MGLFGKRQRPPVVRVVSKIRFIGEQDGAPERGLKTLLVPELVSSNAVRAYLARVQYENASTYEVALCVRGAEDPRLVQAVADHFAKLFRRDTYLDTLFLTEAQEKDLGRVCKPFYGAV